MNLQHSSWLAKGLPEAASVEKLLQPALNGSSFERASRLIRGCYVQRYNPMVAALAPLATYMKPYSTWPQKA